MALRDLVSGGTACAVPGTSSSSNPLGVLANTFLGSSSKTTDRLNELPDVAVVGPHAPDIRGHDPLSSLPGEYDHEQIQYPDNQGSEFLRKFHSGGHEGFEVAWNEAQQPHMPPNFQQRDNPSLFSTFDQIYDGVNAPVSRWEGPPQNILSGFLHQFVHSNQAGIPFCPATLPVMGLSQRDKHCIRDRSSIMARHFFADKSDDYINAQVNALLHSLEIDNDLQARGPPHRRFPELKQYWNESQGAAKFEAPHAEDRWVAEYDQFRPAEGPESWANSFEQQYGVDSWASQFEQEQSQVSSLGRMTGRNISNIAAMEQTRMLAETLAQNEDPKFQNSKFLQFVSKMSRGELIVDNNQVKPAVPSQSSGWVEEFDQQHNNNINSWADQFAGELPHTENAWIREFANEQQQRGNTEDQWVNEFSKLHLQDWGDEFHDQMSKGAFGDGPTDHWADEYDKFLEESLGPVQKPSGSSSGIYVFASQNPYVGHPNPLKEGQELFRNGLLSEAVLALEAEVLKNPDNAEGWRLLGIANAENDDDQQAIASMIRARDADPTNLEVLLALGVSHTNELEQAAALKYLRGWLQHHSKYGTLIPPGEPDVLVHADVAGYFNEAARMAPEDADVHIVLGVLYNLSREFDKAIASFQKALKLKPHDYSLWNKLGATQANSVQSADAIYAYQQALDLKPNYVRAWANMGISFANQGLYDKSISYYVRALSMNPKAENAWQYLRISLGCASRYDMLNACDTRNLDALQKEFPL
ncbi:peroxisome biogenesis protein 5 isoform X2 [Amborella trichopoda]|uniref:peroxisome biogenesis protein 5 isoform X2 n=1 Tax=Amborella trichopoda TaxID=13333 RepID=UPI0005D3D79F|nr:peroxisome biogenesis protein 5 isoform X2 [Amborella trichopoda]|eukprot:XP_011628211.1 peroxisome biogenesis protein 5 isoform X2 [Amborella trichopoda]